MDPWSVLSTLCNSALIVLADRVEGTTQGLFQTVVCAAACFLCDKKPAN